MHEILALATAITLGLGVADAADAPRFGQPITPADLAPWDISIAPDGPLVGGGPLNSTDRDPVKLIGNYWPYATTIFDFTRRAMPWQQPKTLTDDEVYALTAYILALNKIIGENDVMNAETLPKVKMPNRDGFISKYPDKY
jgi:cytochrome c